MNKSEIEREIFLSIVAPAYNEEDNLEKVVNYWNKILKENKIVGEIIITNDGSTDRTKEILIRLQKGIENLLVIHHDTNMGYGKALSSSIKASSGKYVLTLDSDGQFDVSEYRYLLEELVRKKLDLVTGFRRRKQDNIFKIVGDRIFNLIVKLMFQVKLRDTNCAMKLGKGDLLRNINIEAKGYPAPTEIIIKLKALNKKIGEIGVSHYKREKGISKLKFLKTAQNMMKFLVYLKIKIYLYNKKILNNI